jgi:hypothetical protein
MQLSRQMLACCRLPPSKQHQPGHCNLPLMQQQQLLKFQAARLRQAETTSEVQAQQRCM